VSAHAQPSRRVHADEQALEEAKRLRDVIRRRAKGEAARRFWEDEYPRYNPAEYHPVAHKLSKLLNSGTCR